MNGTTIGTIIAAAFAVPWVAMGVRSLGQAWAASLDAVAVASSLTIVAASISKARTHTEAERAGRTDRGFNGLTYGIAVAFMLVAIPLISAALHGANLEVYAMPAVAFIVGVHFLGLARAFGLNRFFWIAGVMCGVAAATVSILPPTLPVPGSASGHVELWDLAVGVGSASTLWGACIHALLS